MIERGSCWSNNSNSSSSITVQVVNYQYNQVGIGEQSYKEWIIAPLISPAPEGTVIHPRSERPEKGVFTDHCLSPSATLGHARNITTHTIWSDSAAANLPTPSHSNR